jgi:hypothetical protein
MKPSDRVEPFIGVANENRSKGQAYPEPYQTPDPEPNEIRLLEASGATNVTETLYSSVTGKTTVIRGSLSSNTETY